MTGDNTAGLSFHHNPLPSAFAGACASLLFALFGAVAQE